MAPVCCPQTNTHAHVGHVLLFTASRLPWDGTDVHARTVLLLVHGSLIEGHIACIHAPNPHTHIRTLTHARMHAPLHHPRTYAAPSPPPSVCLSPDLSTPVPCRCVPRSDAIALASSWTRQRWMPQWPSSSSPSATPAAGRLLLPPMPVVAPFGASARLVTG